MTREEAIEWIKRDISRLPNTPTQNAHKEALNMAIKALEQEPCEIIHGCTYGGVSWGGTYKPQEPCEDAISRQAAIEAFQIFREYESNRNHKEWVDLIEMVLNQLPPVKPQESKTGYWIVHEIENTLRWLECSNCHCETSYNVMHNYCPNCGAKMEVSE